MFLSFPCLIVATLALPFPSHPILSHPILSYPILSYPILSYPILSYPILSYPILSSFSLFYSTLISPLLYYFILLHPTASCFFGFPNLSHTTSSTLIFILILHLDLIRFSSLTHSLTLCFAESNSFCAFWLSCMAFKLSPPADLRASNSDCVVWCCVVMSGVVLFVSR